MVSEYLSRVFDDVEASTTLEKALSQHFGLGAVALSDILRNTPKSLVIRGQFHDQPAIFKRFNQGDPQAMARDAAPLTRRYQEVLQPPCALNPCLDICPPQGVAIYGFIEGTDLMTLFETAPSDTRLKLTQILHQWLHQTATLGQSVERFNPDWLLKNLHWQIRTNVAKENRQIPWRLWGYLERLAQRQKGHPIRQITGHGDCHSGNFIWDGSTLWAIDLEHQAQELTAKMFGRFLSFNQNLGAEPLRFGARRTDFDLLAASPLLEPGEAQVTLPFYTATQLLNYVTHAPVNTNLKKLQIPRLQAAIDDLIALLEPPA